MESGGKKKEDKINYSLVKLVRWISRFFFLWKMACFWNIALICVHGIAQIHFLSHPISYHLALINLSFVFHGDHHKGGMCPRMNLNWSKSLNTEKKKKKKKRNKSWKVENKKWWTKVVKWILGATLDTNPCFK